MNPKDFNRLYAIFERFHSASPRWPAILVHLIDQCDGFIEDFTLHETKTSSHLILKTSELLKSLPDSVSDDELTALLAQEFEGLYFHVIGNEERWSSLEESYSDYKKRIPRFEDISVIDTPHADYEDSFRYIGQLLGNGKYHSGRVQ